MCTGGPSRQCPRSIAPVTSSPPSQLGKWLSKFVRDDAFDEVAYDRAVAMAVREKEVT